MKHKKDEYWDFDDVCRIVEISGTLPDFRFDSPRRISYRLLGNQLSCRGSRDQSDAKIHFRIQKK